ncbi:MAG: hypothetical protein U0S50_06945 [Sphingopyxis sp.]|uniref:hypothetical protein n=1 Tax=Sphingopyxis sp. TaxID=1908224 RepID=UPI002ABBDA1C|nr:hypothetical protein [Sphingopyxis sp.]MDZ3831537.1 hypothetical protein [Sphingopyxis sp.]
MRPRHIRTVAVLILLGGCSAGGDDPAASADGWSIAPGFYSNVAQGADNGEYRGVEVHLAEGSESKTIEIVRCDGWCGQVERQPLRRGLNGVSFAFVAGERTVDVAITPDGADTVELTADWGDGVVSQPLKRVAGPVGLAAARGAPPAE